MTLPRVGESLNPGDTLESQSRSVMRQGGYDDVCARCKTCPYPRGFVVNLGLCWLCAFPRRLGSLAQVDPQIPVR